MFVWLKQFMGSFTSIQFSFFFEFDFEDFQLPNQTKPNKAKWRERKDNCPIEKEKEKEKEREKLRCKQNKERNNSGQLKFCSTFCQTN